MYSALKRLNSLSLVRKVQVIRMFMLLQTILLSLLLFLVQSIIEVFYLEVWIGISWMVIFSLVAAGLVLDLNLSSEV